MMTISKEEYMKQLGTSQEKQDKLIPVTFIIFKYLQVGDIVYRVGDWTYFIKVPYVIDYAKWLKSPPGCYTYAGKTFYYKQISFVSKHEKLYSDSAGTNYKNLYIDETLYQEIQNRIKLKGNKNYG